jgi:hypothetical protein
MSPQCQKSVPVLLVLASTIAGGCGDSDKASPMAPSAMQEALVTGEPTSVIPEVVASASCATGPRFGVRIVITVGGEGGVIVRRLRFTLLDRSGGTSLPTAVSPLSSSSISTPASSTPVPVPGALTSPSSSPVAIPSGTSSVFPFFVEFECGTPTVGTLVATVETEDRKGREKTSEVRIPLGR